MAVALDANGLHLVSVDYETTPTTQTVPRRRKRPEMRMETRTRLLDAAIGLIVAGGVAAASIRGICERAGFSQGAFYSYFASKDDLLFTLVEEHMANLARKFDMLVADTRYQTAEAILDTIGASLDALSVDASYSVLVVELHLHARRNAAFRARFEPVKIAYESAFAGVMSHLLRRTGLTPVIPSIQLARILLSLWSGLILQESSDPPPSIQMRHVFAALAQD
ncbi:TetR/AcrR family transcriptional regulator [Sphingomonas hankookensis]|uniref:TetR/AcrR family transcriptional regulator n=1 Tax=Sphingomonas hankookensis TaxID=563996 RepID=UPI00263418E8|nr:TetR/AcrR family transcriptional regulator [uncultured Sphingomonas sp.]